MIGYNDLGGIGTGPRSSNSRNASPNYAPTNPIERYK